jgi:hypothetical protein
MALFDNTPSPIAVRTTMTILSMLRRSIVHHSGFDHLGPLLGFFRDDLAKLGGRSSKHHGTQVARGDA